MRSQVDTPDGKPNPEWLLLRAHPIYDCPLEHSTIAKYGKRGAWEPRFADAFDELVLFRGPIQNFKNVEAESVGILKCKIKLYRLEDLAEAEARGEEQRFLDMAELKKGKEVPYEVRACAPPCPRASRVSRVRQRGRQLAATLRAALGRCAQRPWWRSCAPASQVPQGTCLQGSGIRVPHAPAQQRRDV